MVFSTDLQLLANSTTLWGILIVTMQEMRMIAGALVDMCSCLALELSHGDQRSNQL